MRDRWGENIGVALFVCALVAQPIFVFAFWSRTWDDSAITMAYARTFAHTGVIEATPGSGIVEGYSTTLWMLVLAALARVVASPAALLAMAKTLSCLLNMLNIVLVRSLVRKWGRNRLADITAAVFGLMELTLYESINAMEGPLMLTLMLTLVLCLPLKRRSDVAIFTICGSLFVLARFEALFLIAPLVLFIGPLRRRLLIAGAWVTTMAAAEVARWRYFAALVPNTITAKRHFPYSMPTMALEIQRHLRPAITLARALVVLLLVLLFACFLRRKDLYDTAKRARQSEFWVKLQSHFQPAGDTQIAVVIAVTGLLIDFGVGQNWGPPDRELFVALPFLIYILLRLTFSLANNYERRRAVYVLLLVLVGYRVVRTSQRLQNPYAPVYMPMITVKVISTLVPPVERMRRAAGLQVLTFASPDVGGPMLFGENLHVIDLGMLCDRRLAQTGYISASQYILKERLPEVIEIHSFWTLLAQVGDSQELYREYVPVVIDRKRYFVRRDVFGEFAPMTVTRAFTQSGHPQPEDDADVGAQVVYPDYGEGDYRINKVYGTYAVFRP